MVLHETHYLRLAYLIEVSIAFNLAYMEVKRKAELYRLLEDLALFAAGQPPPRIEDKNSGKKNIVCFLRRCIKCENGGSLIRFEIPRIQYISRMMSAISSMEPIRSEKIMQPWSNPAKFLKEEYRAWEERVDRLVLVWNAFGHLGFVSGPFWFLVYWFIKTSTDRNLALISLVVSTLFAILFTLVDCGIPDYHDILHSAGFWEYETAWMYISTCVLSVTVLAPPIFWALWTPFVESAHCLGISMAKAYKDNQPNTTSSIINVVGLSASVTTSSMPGGGANTNPPVST